jgi:predicted glutamine amidotransferase
MCQLSAYIGDKPIAPLILKSLELQEPYFAAHATGMGVIDSKGKIRVEKATGPVAVVKKTTKIAKLKGSIGIGHSRYSALAREDPRYDIDAMSHPFTNDDGDIAMMHNGEITNFNSHWEKLKTHHKFKSYTPAINWINDSEVAVHMIDDEVKAGKGFDEALKTVMPKLSGQVLLCLISEREPETIWLANRYQPCYIGIGDDEVMWASSRVGLDPIKNDFKRIYQPPKNSLIKLQRGKVDFDILDPSYKVPEMKLNKGALKDAIVAILEVSELDFYRLRNAMNSKDLPYSFGISREEYDERRRYGVSIVNPLIETLDELMEAGKIKRRIDYRMEGCTSQTPRFAYSLT